MLAKKISVLVKNDWILGVANKEERLLIFVMQVVFYEINEILMYS